MPWQIGRLPFDNPRPRPPPDPPSPRSRCSHLARVPPAAAGQLRRLHHHALARRRQLQRCRHDCHRGGVGRHFRRRLVTRRAALCRPDAAHQLAVRHLRVRGRPRRLEYLRHRRPRRWRGLVPRRLRRPFVRPAGSHHLCLARAAPPPSTREGIRGLPPSSSTELEGEEGGGAAERVRTRSRSWMGMAGMARRREMMVERRVAGWRWYRGRR